MLSSAEIIEKTNRLGAHNYHPKDVVIVQAEGAIVTDPEGNKYYDMLSAYSAHNFGHRHPEIVAVAKEQLDRVTLTSRAFHNDVLCEWLEMLTNITGKEMALPMNTGAEAVETALKTARRWGAEVKGVENGQQEIIVCENNFHGRTIAIISFSAEVVFLAFLDESFYWVITQDEFFCKCLCRFQFSKSTLIHDSVQAFQGNLDRIFNVFRFIQLCFCNIINEAWCFFLAELCFKRNDYKPSC